MRISYLMRPHLPPASALSAPARQASGTRLSWWLVVTCVAAGLLLQASPAVAAGTGSVAVHSSGRYYQDAAGNPRFLIGYYGWAAVPDGYYIDHPSRYATMITQGAPYGINYIRISLGVNRLTSATNPPSWNGTPTPVPFLYVGGKADLNQWDPAFWNGLKAQCQLARDNGIIVHVAIFDGVEIRGQGGASYGYANSFWNPSNQTTGFYANPDLNGNGQIDDGGEFYQTTNFINNTGIGYYQKRLIDKVTTELAGYDNVFYEIGNELLSSSSAWNTAVIDYVKLRTTRPISQCGGGTATNLAGWSQHSADTPAEAKANVASIVGMGYPAWEDPDGPALSNADVSPDDLRRAAWYSFVGGAAGWGGFTVDFWIGGRGFWIPTATYYRNLQTFIQDSRAKFWEMTPQHSLAGNSSENSCLAKPGSEYVVYVLNDASVTLNLSGLAGSAYYRTYDPKTAAFSSQQSVLGGGTATFSKPSGADDWVVHVYTTAAASQTLIVRQAGTITIDGNPADWNVSEFTSAMRGGQSGSGDYALVGFDGGSLYYAAYVGVLPTSAADHTAKVYSRHDATYQYFLVRCDDSDIRYPNATDMNWANDCVEFYIDPGHDHGSAAIDNSSSDVQLVIDANNQRNVYMTTPAYRTQVLSGVTSAVVRDATGWWLEARIAKSALDPDLPTSGAFGVDLNFRDNDNNNDPAQTTVYTWCDNTSTGGFPGKIPDKWGNAFQTPPGQSPYGGVIQLPGRIQAENYDLGGEGVGYHDSDPTNSGAGYRTDGVDIETTSDTGGGYNVGWTAAGEWLAYTVNVAEAGDYDIKVRAASPGSSGRFHIELNGQDVTGVRTVSQTGGWQTWTTVTAAGIHLSAGQQTLRLVMDAGDWNLNYIDVADAEPPPVAWDTMGNIVSIGSGQTPAVATDSLGNIHVVYQSGSALHYKLYSFALTPLLSETIPGPAGYFPHIMCDSNNAPHVTFTELVSNPDMPYARYCYYTNRIGGSWKTPMVAMDAGTTNNLWYPRLALWGGYAYVGFQYGYNGESIGRIVRLTSLSTAPTVDRGVNTATRSCIAMNSVGQLFAPGRNGGAGTYCQQYDSNLNAVGGLYNISSGTGKPGGSTTAYAGPNNVVHMVAWGIEAGGSFPCNDRCGMTYNNTGRRNPDGSYPSCIQGLLGGAAGTGPDGNEPSGWWNDDVAPVIVADATNTAYVAWRGWSPAGEGRITKVNDSEFTQTCSASPACGGSVCNGTTFCPNITRRRWWNCEMAPARSRGVYVVWESAGTIYTRSVGVGAGDILPPGPVTGFTAAPGANSVALSWTNPTAGDFAGVKILCKTTGYPANSSDGTEVYNGPGASTTHSGLAGATTYYYAAFAYDEVPNYSSAATAQATTTNPYCFSEAFSYPNGPLIGYGGWTGGANNVIVVENGTLKIIGGAGTYVADQKISCGGVGGTAGIWLKIKRGAGDATLWSIYFDDAAGVNLARWYGAATYCRGRIGGGGQVTGYQFLTGDWYDLHVRLDFAANTSQFFFNGASIGTLSHAEFGAGDSIGRIRIERTGNSGTVGHYVFFDDMMIGGADATPPAAAASAPSVPITMTGPVRYTVSFSEPVHGFGSGSVQINSTGGASASAVSVSGSGTGPYTVTLSEITGSGTLGVTVKAAGCVDAAGMPNTASAAGATFRVVGADGSISGLRSLPNDTPVQLGNKALYLRQSGFAYIAETDRQAGIRLQGALAGAQDDLVCLSGAMKTTAGGERYVLVDAMASLGTGALSPFGVSNRALIDGLLTGIYVKVWGKVKPGSITGTSFMLTDGSDDAGIRVITSGAPGVTDNAFVSVVGAAGFDGARVVYRE